jgi:DNA-3-methyladenine glycosylase
MLKSYFFQRDVLSVAPELLGKVLVKKEKENEIKMIITEVEAYDGEQDKACHASKGRTGRVEVMYGPAGVWYIYLVYGMYHMLNVVTGDIGYPSAVLIRGTREISGPGRLSKALSIDKELNNKDLSEETGLWIEEGLVVPCEEIVRTSRIGISYAEEWVDKPYRFIWKKVDE